MCEAVYHVGFADTQETLTIGVLVKNAAILAICQTAIAASVTGLVIADTGRKNRRTAVTLMPVTERIAEKRAQTQEVPVSLPFLGVVTQKANANRRKAE